jgi:hypothetical protein
MKLSKVIRTVIVLARAIPPERYGTPNKNGAIVIRLSDIPTNLPPSPEKKRLREFLMKQSAATIYALLIMMYYGSGVLGRKLKFLEEYTTFSERMPKPQWAVNQMMGKTYLANYLERGMEMAAKAGLAVDEFLESSIRRS